MQKKRVLVVNDFRDLGSSYYRPFASFGDFTNDFNLLENSPKDISLVVFTGGSDVSPSFYKEENKHSHCNYKRDREEAYVFNLARNKNIPMVGICRGVQFLNVMCGGKMYQHVSNHGCMHDVDTIDGKKFKVLSTHHQMVRPGEGCEVVAWSSKRLSNVYLTGEGEALHPEKEVEAVIYKKHRAGGVQWHPEAMNENEEAFIYTVNLAKTLMAE